MRPANDDDAPMLVGWHRDPDVMRFWDDEVFTLEEIVDRLARPDVDAYIVEERGDPVGYLQAWFEASEEAERCGLDMFLIPSARGRGLGPDAAIALTRWLWSTGRYEVTVDPYVENERAVAAWRKAGFRIDERRPPDEEHRRPWYLMVAAGADLKPS